MDPAKGELQLGSGRVIALAALDQSLVYGGLIEGLPTRELNARIVGRLSAEARRRDGYEALLIEANQRPIPFDGHYPFGEPASLPRIGCVGRFVSTGEDAIHATYLTVIWFQDAFALPLDEEARRAIEAMDWDRLARSVEL